MNPYELTDEEATEIYEHWFTTKEQFANAANPDNPIHLEYATGILDSEVSMRYTLILYRNESFMSFSMAFDHLDDYRLFDDETARTELFYELIHDSVDNVLEEGLTDGANGWLSYYVDTDAIEEDRATNSSYAEILSSYDEEIEYVLNGETYYLYKY